MTILIDENKKTTAIYGYMVNQDKELEVKVKSSLTESDVRIVFKNDVFDSVSIQYMCGQRTNYKIYAAIAEKITELEKKYSEVVSIEQGVLEPDEDDELTEVLVGIQDNLENPYMDEYHYDENIKIEYIEFINKKGKCIRKQRKIYAAGTCNILAILDGFLKCEKPEVPTMQSFVDRFREECPACDIQFFGDSAGGSIYNNEHGCVSWHPEKGETIDQAMKKMKGKIDANN